VTIQSECEMKWACTVYPIRVQDEVGVYGTNRCSVILKIDQQWTTRDVAHDFIVVSTLFI